MTALTIWHHDDKRLMTPAVLPDLKDDHDYMSLRIDLKVETNSDAPSDATLILNSWDCALPQRGGGVSILCIFLETS